MTEAEGRSGRSAERAAATRRGARGAAPKARARSSTRGRGPRRAADPGKAWARQLERRRPGLVDFVLDGLSKVHGHPTWTRWHDPTSELVLTILSQNSADVNAERAFESLRVQYPRHGGAVAQPDGLSAPASPEGFAARAGGDRALEAILAAGRIPRPGWGGQGLTAAADPDWESVENAPLPELVDAIRPGGLAVQKAPRIQASLKAIREASGGYSLEFLGEMPARDARDWLTRIGGIGPKTASVVLLFSFGLPLMPVDRHVERVSRWIGLIPPRATADEAHDLYLALLPPERMYEAHVNLITHGRRICHARRPACAQCPVAPRCRYVDRKAP
jgi:endonuclease III